jgi:hypothetical protein
MAGTVALAGASTASVVNQGSLQGNSVALVAAQVLNSGNINTPGGTTALAAGQAVDLDFNGDKLLAVRVNVGSDGGRIDHSGVIHADGSGRVIMTAAARNALLNTAINVTGRVSARGVTLKGGEVFLDSGAGGTTELDAGQIDVSSAQGVGGAASVLGSKVGVLGLATIHADGENGGGTVLIGGNYQGRGPERNADFVFFGADAKVSADALSTGDGGKVIVWSEDTTRFAGSVFARGGRFDGAGGFVETSGKRALLSFGAVDASAANGLAGTWLLDPFNITVSAGSENSDGLTTGNPSTPKGTYTASGSVSTVTKGNLERSLLNSNVTISTDGDPGSENGNISVQASVSWSSGKALTLVARKDITIDAAVTSTNSGSLKLKAINGSINTQTAGTIDMGAGAVELNAKTGINILGSITSGLTTLKSTGASGSGISATLNNASNRFGTLTLAGESGGKFNDVNIKDANVNGMIVGGSAVTLAATATGPLVLDGGTYTTLNATAGGNITQNSAVVAEAVGLTSTNSAGISVNLVGTQLNNNDFNTVTLTGSGGGTFSSVNIKDGVNGMTISGSAASLVANAAGALVLAGGSFGSANFRTIGNSADITVSGNLTATSGGFGFSAGRSLNLNANVTTAQDNGDVVLIAGPGGSVNIAANKMLSVGRALVVDAPSHSVLGSILFSSTTNSSYGSVTVGGDVSARFINTPLNRAGAQTDDFSPPPTTGEVTLGAGSVTATNTVTGVNNVLDTLDRTASGLTAPNITVSTTNGGLTVAGPVTATGGDITLGASNSIVLLGDVIANGTSGTVRLVAGANIVQAADGGKIITKNLGARADGDVFLAQANGVSGTFAAQSTNGNILFKNASGYTIGQVSSDAASLFATTDGIAAANGFGITLDTASGTVNQAASMNVTTAGVLALAGEARYDLVSTGNNVGTLTATTGAGALRYVDENALTIGDGSSGIVRTGNVSINTRTGDLTLTGSIDVGAHEVRLQATEGAIWQGVDSVITAGKLGARAGGAITLGSTNVLSSTGTFAASAGGDVLFKNQTGYTIGQVASDSTSLFAVTDGIAAANGARVTLDTVSGTVNQAASTNVTTTGALALAGEAGYDLVSTGNNVGTLTATTGAGALRYVDENALTIGDGSSGIVRTGNVSINTRTGDLTLTGSIDVGAHEVRLQATEGAIWQGVDSVITAGKLGARAGGAITLGSTNVLSSTGTFAASAGGDVLFKNQTGYTIGQVASDSTSLFAVTDGIAAANGARVTLDTVSGTVNQAASTNVTTTGALALAGEAGYDLVSTGNNVGTLTATTGAGALRYVDENALTIGDGSSGIVRTGNVSINTRTGDLTLTGSIDVGAHEVRLQATGGAIWQDVDSVITAGKLGARAGGAITLGSTNVLISTGTFAASAGGNVLFKNQTGYTIGQVSADEADLVSSTTPVPVFADTNGIRTLGDGKNIRLEWATGALTQADTSSSSGIVQATGSTTFVVTGTGDLDGAIDLTNPNNDFAGPIGMTLAGGGAVAVHSGKGIQIGESNFGRAAITLVAGDNNLQGAVYTRDSQSDIGSDTLSQVQSNKASFVQTGALSSATAGRLTLISSGMVDAADILLTAHTSSLAGEVAASGPDANPINNFQIRSTTVNLGEGGVLAQRVFLWTDVVTTRHGAQGAISLVKRATKPQFADPVLIFKGLNGIGQFGIFAEQNTANQWLSVDTDDQVSVIPSSDTSPAGRVYLAGPVAYGPKYVFATNLTKRSVVYNGATPDAPQFLGAITSATAPLRDTLKDALSSGFSKENLRKQLTEGSVLQTGVARPGIDRIDNAQSGESCSVDASSLTCANR